MSARLISLTDGVQQHDLQDDLESSIYILLWMTLMYSPVLRFLFLHSLFFFEKSSDVVEVSFRNTIPSRFVLQMP